MPFNCPVLYLNYNRADLTARSLGRLSELKPVKLYISCDGPKPQDPADEARVSAVRDILDNIEWPTEVKRNYFNENQGCKYGVSKAIDWFFENEDMGIIIEDDVLPSLSFFYFAKSNLEHFYNEERVMHITGNCFSGNSAPTERDAYFSVFPHIWGWATWKRAWQKYSVNMEAYKADMDFPYVANAELKDYFKKYFLKTFAGEIDTWDYQWTYTVWKNEGLCLTPVKNLIENIGFGEDATHTKRELAFPEMNQAFELEKPYILPENLQIDTLADNATYENIFKSNTPKPGILKRVVDKLKRLYA